MQNLFLVSININTDIFETNIINIALLVVLLFNVVGAALKNAMLERKTKILTEVEGAEKSLTEAVERLSQAETQSKQSVLIINQIEEKTEKLRNQILTNNWNRALEETSRLEKAARLAVEFEKRKVARENQDALLTAALTNAYMSVINDVAYDELCQLNMKRIDEIPAVI